MFSALALTNGVRWPRPGTWAAAGVLGVITATVLWPVASLLSAGGTPDLWQPLRDDHLLGRMTWTVAQAGLTALLSLMLGLPIGWALARHEFAGRTLVLRALMLPFVMPTLVAALGVIAIWGPPGAGADTGPFLLLMGNLFFNLGLVVRAVVEGLSRVSAARVAAARTLGATPWRAFWRVQWPAVQPWLSSALCLVFLYGMGSLGLAMVLGGTAYATAEVEIYTLVAHQLELAQAAALALWMLGLNALAALGWAWVQHKLAVPARADGLPRWPAARWCRQPARAAAVVGALCALFVLCAAPMLAVLWRAAEGAAVLPALMREEETWLALGNTLRFTLSAVLLATAMGAVHALLARHSPWLRGLAFVPMVVSPVTLAFGLLVAYPLLSASMMLLVVAYALLAYPFVAQSLMAALDAIPPHLTQAARTLGARPARLLLRVTLPLVMPALRRGMALAAATAIGEFAVSLFLSRPEWLTLTTLMHQHLGRPGETNLQAAYVLAAVLMGLALCVFSLIEGRSQKAGLQVRGGLA